MLSTQEKEDLVKRCKYAQAHGFQIACAEDIAKELGFAGGDPPPKVKKFSPAHLLHLLGAAPGAAPKLQASAKFSKAGKAKKAAAAAQDTQENIPTVPVDIKAVAAAVAEMKAHPKEGSEDT